MFSGVSSKKRNSEALNPVRFLETGHPVADGLHVCLHEKQRLKVSYEDERGNGS
jgi:hypothetical protein